MSNNRKNMIPFPSQPASSAAGGSNRTTFTLPQLPRLPLTSSTMTRRGYPFSRQGSSESDTNDIYSHAISIMDDALAVIEDSSYFENIYDDRWRHSKGKNDGSNNNDDDGTRYNRQ